MGSKFGKNPINISILFQFSQVFNSVNAPLDNIRIIYLSIYLSIYVL